MRKRLLALILTLVMVLTMLPATALAAEETWAEKANTDWYNDTDAEFTLTTAEQLAGLAKLVNGGNTFSKKTIKLGADIDLAGKEWTPIGKSGANFQGTFDGQKHTISNLTVTETEAYAGLFGILASPGVIKDVTVDNATVSAQQCAGPLAGSAFTGTVENCKATGMITVTGNYKLGGLIGEGYADLTGCSVEADEGSAVTATYLQANLEGDNVGGLIGYRGEGGNEITDCSVSGLTVTGTRKVAGLVGSAFDDNVITDCTVNGVAVASNASPEYIAANAKSIAIGGLVGLYTGNGDHDGSLTDCTVEDVALSSKNPGVRMDYLTGGARGSDSVLPAPTGESWNESDNNIDDEENTGANTDTGCATVKGKIYDSLAAAIAAANAAPADNSTVTVTITESGTYAPFTITRNNVAVQADDGVDAVIEISKDSGIKVYHGYAKQSPSVAFRNIDFVSRDGSVILNSYYFGDENHTFAAENCSFVNKGEAAGAIAIYVDFPNVTIDGCTFENWETAYYTAGEGYAIDQMNVTGNTYTNVKTIVNGYWQHEPKAGGCLTISGNKIDPGTWGNAGIVLWDWAQYQAWLNDQTESVQTAIKANIHDNTMTSGELEYHKIHCDWYTKSDITLPENAKVINYALVDVQAENATAVAVYDKNGELVANLKQEKNGKTCIYQIPEGEYTFQVTQSQIDGDSVVTSYDVTVKAPTNGSETQTFKVEALPATMVAQVDKTQYPTLAEAVEAAKDGGKVKLLADVSVETWNQTWNAKDLTIDGDGHTVTIGKVESNVNGNYLFYGAENLQVSNLTIRFTTNGNGFSMVSGKLENVKMYGGPSSSYAVFVGTSDAKDAKVEISKCVFEGFSSGVYSQPAANGNATSAIAVDGSAFNNCDYAVVSYAANTAFTNNTVNDAVEVSFAGAAENAERENTYTVTGNAFQNAGKIWFYGADLGKVTFTKNQLLGNTTVSTDDAKADTKLDVQENYWGGGAPTADQLKGDNVTGSDVYYTRDTMNPSDLNTYHPSSSGTTTKPVEKPKLPFTDVTGHWALDAITYVYEKGMMNGTTDTTFSPNAELTRGMIVSILYRLEKEPAVSGGSAFTDVSGSMYYADAIAWAAANGIVTGYTDTTFGPDDSVTREQLAAILYRYAVHKGMDAVTMEENLTGFSDAGQVSAYAVQAMNWAVGQKLITGVTATTLKPQGTATRGQVATILMRYCETIAK